MVMCSGRRVSDVRMRAAGPSNAHISPVKSRLDAVACHADWSYPASF